MKKTCINCAYYHGCLSEAEPSQYHIHNYCDKWNCVIEKDMESEINSFLEDYWDDLVWKEDEYGVSTDFETGEAVCWMYYPNEKEDSFLTDERLEKNRLANRDLALRTLNKLLSTGKCHALEGEFLIDIPQEDLMYLDKLREALLKEE